MANEEHAHLVDALKTCTQCHLEGMHKFLYYNNSSQLQPRYECLGCGQQFTNGGVAYHKTNRKKFKARPLSPPRAPTPPHSLAPPVADRDRVCTLVAANAARLTDNAEKAGGGESAGPSGAHTRSRALRPQRPRFPSQADHDRARARMARDAARQAQVEAGGGGEAAGLPGEQVVMGIRVTTGPSGVVHVPPAKRLYQVKTKVPGEEDIVRCVLMDLNSGIPDDY